VQRHLGSLAASLALSCGAPNPVPASSSPVATASPTDTAVVAPPPAPVPPPTPPPPPPKGCWEETFGQAPGAGSGRSFDAPVPDCEGCDALAAGPAAVGLHPEVLRRLLAIQNDHPPRIDEPVLWINSGKREGPPSKSMHNQGLAVDVVVCGHDTVGTAKILREAGFTCVIEYYAEDGSPCWMAHGDMRGTTHAKSAYRPEGSKSDTCPTRGVHKGVGCQGTSKEDWSYAPP
jgi:hypothetical protein